MTRPEVGTVLYRMRWGGDRMTPEAVEHKVVALSRHDAHGVYVIGPEGREEYGYVVADAENPAVVHRSAAGGGLYANPQDAVAAAVKEAEGRRDRAESDLHLAFRQLDALAMARAMLGEADDDGEPVADEPRECWPCGTCGAPSGYGGCERGHPYIPAGSPAYDPALPYGRALRSQDVPPCDADRRGVFTGDERGTTEVVACALGLHHLGPHRASLSDGRGVNWTDDGPVSPDSLAEWVTGVQDQRTCAAEHSIDRGEGKAEVVACNLGPHPATTAHGSVDGLGRRVRWFDGRAEAWEA